MSNPTTDEWTVETIAHLQARGGIDAIVAAHNAALAAEREKVKDAQEEAFAAYAEVDALREQLAAEREKLANLQSQMNTAQGNYIRRLNELTAEREVGHNQAITLGQHIARLEDQLATAVAALKVFENEYPHVTRVLAKIGKP